MSEQYWIATCPKCGWVGSSKDCAGGGAIADTGDYDDCTCPDCFKNGEGEWIVVEDAGERIAKLESQLTAECEARQRAELATSSWRNHYDAVSIAANNYRSRAEAAEKLHADEQDMRIAEEKLRRAAEARIKASQEQEPVAWLYQLNIDGQLCSTKFSSEQSSKPYGISGKDHGGEVIETPLYAIPIIPPEVAELQRENAELTRKLAEQQIKLDKAWLIADCEDASEETLDKIQAAVKNEPTELVKLLEEAKRQAVPEGMVLVRKDLFTYGDCIKFGVSISDIRSAAPQPERKD